MEDRVFSGAVWEKQVGHCRARRVGDHVWVSGTAPVSPEGGTHAPGDAYAQALRCLQIIEAALARFGAAMRDVVQTRMFVTDIERWSECGRAHAEVFGAHPPATSMVQVERLIADDMLIEIEAEAVIRG